MAKYSLDIKSSAQKELDALDDALFARIERKIMSLAENPRPAGCKKLKGYRTNGEFAWAIGAWFTSLMTAKLWQASPASLTAEKFTNHDQSSAGCSAGASADLPRNLSSAKSFPKPLPRARIELPPLRHEPS